MFPKRSFSPRGNWRFFLVMTRRYLRVTKTYNSKILLSLIKKEKERRRKRKENFFRSLRKEAIRE